VGAPQQMTKTVSQARTHNYSRQVKGSAIFKGLAVAASFFAIPLMIKYLGQEQFGVWSTLLSVMSWIVFFDLGIGNGLRNKVAESLAKNEMSEAANYIATGYSLIGFISAGLFIIVASVTFFVPWQSIFNTHAIPETTLRYTVLLVAFSVMLNFLIGLINQVMDAAQKSSAVVFGQFITNTLALLFVFILSKTTGASIILLAVAYGISLIIANGAMSYWFFRKQTELLPTFAINIKHIRPLLSLGGRFFIIQLAVLVLFASDKILITQLLGPEYVTQYDVVFKLFSIVTLAFSLITAPLLSAYSDAYHRQDFLWIQKSIQNQLKIFVLLIIVTTILIILASQLIKLWIGAEINPPLSLVISMGVFVVIAAWSGIFSYVLNAISEIKMQMHLAIFAMLANIPLAILLVRHFQLGSSGVVLSNCICMVLFAVLGPIKVNTILRKDERAVKTQLYRKP
jgi:O-antigen/teichoic acid export membrane protein